MSQFEQTLLRTAQPWIRPEAPAVSVAAAALPWAASKTDQPCLVRHGDGGLSLYFCGTSGGSKWTERVGRADLAAGLSSWAVYPAPVITPEQLPWGGLGVKTPCVVRDGDPLRLRCWFVDTVERAFDPDGRLTHQRQALGAASSTDGGWTWQVEAGPNYPSCRSPSVHAIPGGWCMWANSHPGGAGVWYELYENIYRFTSPDGVNWTRDAEPCVTAAAAISGTVIYPWVMSFTDRLGMWHGGHYQGGFHIFFRTSTDGHTWTEPEAPAFSPSSDASRFDAGYVSQPSVVDMGTHYLMAYGARDAEKKEYQGIGVAALVKSPHDVSWALDASGRIMLAWAPCPGAAYNLNIVNRNTGGVVVSEDLTCPGFRGQDTLPAGSYRVSVRANVAGVGASGWIALTVSI